MPAPLPTLGSEGRSEPHYQVLGQGNHARGVTVRISRGDVFRLCGLINGYYCRPAIVAKTALRGSLTTTTVPLSLNPRA
jgi:hypothetical protein